MSHAMDKSVKKIVSALIVDDFANALQAWKHSPYCDQICQLDKLECEKSAQNLKCIEYLENMLTNLALEKRDTNFRYFADQVRRKRKSI
jgi:hypothetical protein